MSETPNDPPGAMPIPDNPARDPSVGSEGGGGAPSAPERGHAPQDAAPTEPRQGNPDTPGKTSPPAREAIQRGKVIELTPETVVLEMPGSIRASLPLTEFAGHPTPQVGDEVSVIVERSIQPRGPWSSASGTPTK